MHGPVAKLNPCMSKVTAMNSTSYAIKVVLIDEMTLQSMRFNDMLGRIDQMKATGRYRNVHINQSGVFAEMIA